MDIDEVWSRWVVGSTRSYADGSEPEPGIGGGIRLRVTVLVDNFGESTSHG